MYGSGLLNDFNYLLALLYIYFLNFYPKRDPFQTYNEL